jgi:hypothetical protein
MHRSSEGERKDIARAMNRHGKAKGKLKTEEKITQ